MRGPNSVASTALVPAADGLKNASDHPYFLPEMRKVSQGERFSRQGYFPLSGQRIGFT